MKILNKGNPSANIVKKGKIFFKCHFPKGVPWLVHRKRTTRNTTQRTREGIHTPRQLVSYAGTLRTIKPTGRQKILSEMIDA